VDQRKRAGYPRDRAKRAWLDPETPPADAKQLLHENLDSDLEFYRVGREVNTSAKDKQPYDLPSMIEPIALNL
jgi:putative SOS response-associated peptidase YedK